MLLTHELKNTIIVMADKNTAFITLFIIISCSPQFLDEFILTKEAWNCMPRPNVKVLGKPLCTDVGITAPRICVETIISSLVHSD